MARRALVAAHVYDVLRDRLTAGLVQPGSRLNLSRVARELNVSNTPVRHALARLQADGFVVQEVNRGYVVSPLLDLRAIAELYDYRLLVEPVAAARAARRPDEVVDELAAMVDERAVSALIADPLATTRLRERDVAFHSKIAEIAGNRVVVCHLNTALRAMTPFRRFHSSETAMTSWAEHRAIVDSLRAADPTAAAEAMTSHLRNSHDRLRCGLPRSVDVQV